MSWPDRDAYGLPRPNAGIAHQISSGRVAAAASYVMPASTSGRGNAVSTTTTSTCPSSRRTTSAAAGCLRSSASERLPRWYAARPPGIPRTGSFPSGGSTRITSAPRSARSMVQNAPGNMRVRSSTRSPASGRSPPPLDIVELVIGPQCSTDCADAHSGSAGYANAQLDEQVTDALFDLFGPRLRDLVGDVGASASARVVHAQEQDGGNAVT